MCVCVCIRFSCFSSITVEKKACACIHPSFFLLASVWHFSRKNKRATSFFCYYIFPRLIPLPRPVYSRQQKECVQYYYIEKVTSGLFIHISRFFPIFVFFNIFLSIESKKELIYCPTPLHLSIYLSVARNIKKSTKKNNCVSRDRLFL